MTGKKNGTPKLGYVIVYVPDVAKTVEFYERAFDLQRRFVHESGQYAELETGTTALAFADEGMTPTRDAFLPNRADRKAAGAEIGLIVDDVSSAFRKAVANGAVPVVEPVEKPWGQTVSYVRDLHGFLVEICTAVG